MPNADFILNFKCRALDYDDKGQPLLASHHPMPVRALPLSHLITSVVRANLASTSHNQIFDFQTELTELT